MKTKLIKLTHGKFALVDALDFEWLNQWKWHLGSKGYAVRSQYTRREGGRKISNIKMHRLIIQTEGDMQTDHINRNRLDNRRSNLRIVTRLQNLRNTTVRTSSTSGFIGVTKKTSGKWKATIKVNKKSIFLGHYNDLRMAWLARRLAERLYFGADAPFLLERKNYVA